MKEDKNFSITISWNVEDVDAILEMWGEDEGRVFVPALTLQEKIHVLKNVDAQYDANFGISWQTLEDEIMRLYGNRLK